LEAEGDLRGDGLAVASGGGEAKLFGGRDGGLIEVVAGGGRDGDVGDLPGLVEREHKRDDGAGSALQLGRRVDGLCGLHELGWREGRARWLGCVLRGRGVRDQKSQRGHGDEAESLHGCLLPRPAQQVAGQSE
jgi:hypothetical protein